MATVPAPPPLEVITMTFGPFLTGIMMQQLFMGVIVVQVYDYYRSFPNDSRFNKWLVATLTGVSILQCIMDYLILYRCSVTYYGNFDKFDDTDWSLWWEIAVTAIIGTIAQSFFLERCWSATKSWTVVVIGIAAIGLSLGSGLASTIEFMRIGRLSRVPEIPGPITTWLVSTAICDLGIAAILVWSITRVRSKFRRTESIIGKIVRLTFQTSALTAAIAIVNVVLYLALPAAAFHLLPQMVMGKIYAISVMVTLAARTELRDMMNSGGNSTYVDTRPGQTTVGSTKLDFTTSQNNLAKSGIQVNTTTYVQRDIDGKVDPATDIELGRYKGDSDSDSLEERKRGVQVSRVGGAI